jgi:hypothetical protein
LSSKESICPATYIENLYLISRAIACIDPIGHDLMHPDMKNSLKPGKANFFEISVINFTF